MKRVMEFTAEQLEDLNKILLDAETRYISGGRADLAIRVGAIRLHLRYAADGETGPGYPDKI